MRANPEVLSPCLEENYRTSAIRQDISSGFQLDEYMDVGAFRFVFIGLSKNPFREATPTLFSFFNIRLTFFITLLAFVRTNLFLFRYCLAESAISSDYFRSI